MKIKITEYATEIYVDASELRESNTLAVVASLLKRRFQNHEPFEEADED